MSKLIALNLGNPSKPERRSSTPANPSVQTLGIFGVRSTASGADVNERSAMRCGTVFTCIKILAETSAMLPFKVYRTLDPAGKAPDPKHPLFRVLHDEMNSEMSAMTGRETLTGHLAGWGNAYANKEMTGGGVVKALWPLRPDTTFPDRLPDGRLVYHTVLADGEARTLRADEVLHLRGLSYDGLCGYSPIGQVREAIGLALATEEFGARFFGQGAIPGIALTHPGLLSTEAKQNIRESWNEKHQGLTRTHRLAILEEGLSIEKIGIPPEDAQFLETRQFQKREIATLYRIPLHMVNDMEKGAGFSSVEHLGQEFITFSLMPWLVRWEQESNRSLLTPTERLTWFVKHVVAALARGDLKSRNQAYAIGRQWGWLSADDVRELEDMNPLPDGQGSTYLSPMNMVPADQLGDEPTADALRLVLVGAGRRNGGSHDGP